MTTEQQRRLILAAMMAAQEQAMADGELGGAEAEVAELRALLDDPEAMAAFFASFSKESVAQAQESRQGVDLGASQPASRLDLLEAVGKIADAIQHRKPAPKMTELIRDQRGLIAGWRVIEQEGVE